MKPHVAYIEDETGRDTDQVAAYIHEASEKSVNYILGLPIDKDQRMTDEARSEWVWLRLQDGTLALATFPQADAYSAVEVDAQFPQTRSNKQ